MTTETRADWLFSSMPDATPDECVLWPFSLSQGYGTVWFDGRVHMAYRLVCTWAHGPAPFPKAHAAHSCGVRRCVNPHHIRWATRTQNERDKHIHGTSNRGERHGMHVLTADAVRSIRELRAAGIARAVVAEKFNISLSSVSRVARGRGWRSVA